MTLNLSFEFVGLCGLSFLLVDKSEFAGSSDALLAFPLLIGIRGLHHVGNVHRKIYYMVLAIVMLWLLPRREGSFY